MLNFTNKYDEYLSEEDKKLAKYENQDLTRFVTAFLFAMIYGALAFFLVWRMHDVLPSVLNMYFPGKHQNDPFRLYRFCIILLGGVSWFITFCLVWSKMSDDKKPLKRKLLTLLGWCVGCGIVYLLVELAYRFLLIG